MEIPSYAQEDDGRFGGRTLSDISIASSASGKAPNVSSFGASKHVRDTRVKFLCSYGGQILPRPSDKRLRYVGGDTRMISVPRHIQLTDLRLKLAEVYGHDVTLKYQLPEEELDALVSVSSEEDLENMMEECDRLHVMEGSMRLRVFVFSSSDQDAIDFNDVADSKVSEHRYVEAVNAVQADAPSSRHSESMLPSDVYKFFSGIHPSNVLNISGMQGRFPGISESLRFHPHPLEQFTPAGNHPFSVLPQKNDLLGRIAPPSRVAIAKSRNELASSMHAPNINFHGPPAAIDDFFDLESEQIANRIGEDHLSREEVMVRREAKVATSTSPIFGKSDVSHRLDASSENQNQVYEEQPLSPGALLQRQLQADQTLFETPLIIPFAKQSSQSSLDENDSQPQLFHERQQLESLPLQHLVNDYNQECVMVDGHLLSEPLKIPVSFPLSQGSSSLFFHDNEISSPLMQSKTTATTVTLSQQAELKDTCLPSAGIVVDDSSKSPHSNDVGNLKAASDLMRQPCTDSPVLSGLQTNVVGTNKSYALDGPIHHALVPTTAPPDHIPLNDANFCMGTESMWLLPDLVSFPPRDDPQINMLDKTKHQTHVSNSSSLHDKCIVGAGGMSLLDEPIHFTNRPFRAAMSDVKQDPIPATMRDSSMVDIRSNFLPSIPTMNCGSPLADPLCTTLLESFAKLDKDEVSLAMATDALSLDRASENIRLGLSHDADAFRQPVYQEAGVCLRMDDIEADICQKGIVDAAVEEGRTTLTGEEGHSSFTLLQEAQSIPDIVEDLNYPQELVESTLMMNGDLTIETSTLEGEEEDTFSSAADRPVNTAAIAETEAIARGLQTIRNFDLEELRELGSGTFGTVYHGKWRGTDVAIKRIKSSCFTGRPSERERLIADFWQEAFILGQLHHPNVVAFYGVVPDGPGGTLATVTEYMVNNSLKQALQKKDRVLDRRKRLIIAMDAAFGMEYLHKKNVVHFDLKCENLLVNLRDIHRPICKVGDLGLSKVKQQTMISGGVRGTLPWMAPELLNGGSSLVSEKVDIYSFGIVLWELLTGEEPYASMHYGAIIGGIVSNTLRPPVPQWCDPAWRSCMEACWAADPSERPTFTEIANCLRAMEAAINAKGQGQAQNVE